MFSRFGLTFKRYVTVTETFTAAGAGNWVAPTNLHGNSVIVECGQAGSGGDGGTNLGAGGGGGAEGTYARSTLNVVKGSTYPYVVGAAGGGAVYNTTAVGGTGGASTFLDTDGTTELVAARGAVGGGQGRFGGAAATTGSVGDSIQIGASGGTADGTVSSAGGAGGGGTAITGSPSGFTRGAGGAGGVTGSLMGKAGTSPCSGGGGGRGAGGAPAVGGNGTDGRISITYTVVR